jgi:hypothetical protein
MLGTAFAGILALLIFFAALLLFPLAVDEDTVEISSWRDQPRWVGDGDSGVFHVSRFLKKRYFCVKEAMQTSPLFRFVPNKNKHAYESKDFCHPVDFFMFFDTSHDVSSSTSYRL